MLSWYRILLMMKVIFLNVRNLNYFKGVHVPIILRCKSINILIGQTDKLLLTIVKEREGLQDEPNLVITLLGPIASSSRANLGSNFPPNLELEPNKHSDACKACKRL